MKEYSIEHIGILAEDPVAIAKWYADVLGFKIKLVGEDSEKSVAFITDKDEKVMLEFGKIPNVSSLCKKLDNPLQLHICLKSKNIEEDVKYLVSNGAKYIETCPIKRPEFKEGLTKENLIILKDPWDNTIQLVKGV